MKKLTPKQMFDLIDFLYECKQEYTLNAVNSVLAILGYDAMFNYESDEDAIRYNGVLETE